MSGFHQIPKLPHRFFKWYCKKELYEEIHGDLEEYFYERVNEKGLKKAQRMYCWDVIKCCQPYAWKGLESQTNSNIAMFKNFYYTTIRNLLKHKSYFAINVLGLSVGIACLVFITLFLNNELSYDRFHSNYQSIYRVGNEAVIRGEPNKQATTSGPMAQILLDNYPEVLKATRIHASGQLLIGKGGKKINEEGILFANESFFDVFDFKLLKGDPETALKHPKSMVISESYVKKYFGDADPMGQQLSVDEDTTFYTITGVVRDVPANSHIKFNLLGSISSNKRWNVNRWVGTSQHTYVVLNEGVDIPEFEKKIHQVFYDHMAPEIEYYTGLKISEWEASGNTVEFKLKPIADIHLKSDSLGELETSGNIAHLYIYGLIGIVILFIGVFNFINLATAHSSTRAKEVGIRKVIGSNKRTLVFQFLFESILIASIACSVGLILVIILKPYFISLIGKEISFSILYSFFGLGTLLLLAMVVGLLAGFYPSFVLSSFKPVAVLKGKAQSGRNSIGWLRNFLVTIQFATSIIIIIGTFVVYTQVNYMTSKNLGFDKEQTLVIQRPDWLKSNLEVFKQEIRRNPNVKQVANSETIPGKNYDIRSYRKVDAAETFLFLNNQVTYEHMEVLGLELVAGRFFSKEFPSDSNAVVINEAAAKAFGYEDPIGKPLTSAFKKDRPIKIIGVIKDYQFESLHKATAPLSLELDQSNNSGYVAVQIVNSENILETVKYIDETYRKLAGDKPMQSFFFDEEYERLYKTEVSTARVLVIFASISVFIACIGLIGLITYSAALRRKEIGIRKVLGAATSSLVKLLSGNVVRLIVIATIISWPLAYFATDYWLQNFADRVEINPWIYIGSTICLIMIVGFAISFQTIKAALGNPVESLRDE